MCGSDDIIYYIIDIIIDIDKPLFFVVTIDIIVMILFVPAILLPDPIWQWLRLMMMTNTPVLTLVLVTRKEDLPAADIINYWY